jgi:toxin ParE1/3/4
MVQKVIWSDAAMADMADIKEYLMPISPVNAERVVMALDRAGANLSSMPGRGRRIPEFADPMRRETFVHEWRLMYRIEPELVRILRVIHGRRLLSNVHGSFEESEQEAYASQ